LADGCVTLAPVVRAAADCVVIHTDHATFDYEWIVAHSRVVLDTRTATRDVTEGRAKVVRL
jgi:UDP-N-acetyl-D-glucosamine dehydrogenase